MTKDKQTEMHPLLSPIADKVIAWQKEYAPRKLSIIVVEDKVAVLRPIGATEVSGYSMLLASTNSLADAAKYLLTELWLGGDYEITDNEEYFIAAMLQLQNIMEIKKSTFFQL